MMTYTFTFKNFNTGETKTATGFSLNDATRSLGLAVLFKGKLSEPWRAIECRAGNMLCWRELAGVQR
jgi:hypothetical protein